MPASCVVPLTPGHRILWRRGAVVACDHPRGDLVLAALGGDVCPCLLAVQACGPAAVDAGLLEHAELLDRLGGESAHLRTGKVDVVARSVRDTPVDRRRRALALAHLLDRPVLDRIVLGRLVGHERRLPPPGSTARWGLDAAVGVRASRAVRTAFGPLARGRIRVLLEVCEPDVDPVVSLDGPSAVRIRLRASWVRTVWWEGRAVLPGGRFVLDGSRAVRLDRTRRGPVVVEVAADA